MKTTLALLMLVAISAVCMGSDSSTPASGPATAPASEPANPGGAVEKVAPLPGGGKVSIITHNGGRLTNWRPPGARHGRPATASAPAPASAPATAPADNANADGAPEKVAKLPGGGKVSIITHNGGRLTNWRPPGVRQRGPASRPASEPVAEPATQPAGK